MISRKLRSAVLIVLGALSISAHAAEESIKRVVVPAGPLTLALKTLAEQSGVEFFYSTDQLEGLKTHGVQGEYTAEKAVLKLLEGTNLKLTRHESGALVITMPKTAAAESSSSQKRLRLAQSDSPAPQSRVGGGEVRERAGKAGAASPESVELEEVTVTGSRLKSQGIETTAPVTVFDRAEIDRLGISSVSDVLLYLPQQTFNFNDEQVFGGARFAQLRGLSVGTTLVLINGRRTVPSGPNVSANAFDLNTIPLAAVERIEILSDSASAVYGADAVGGVINVLLKDVVERPVLDLHYGAASGGADERRASFSAGYSTLRFRGSLNLDYFDRRELLGAHRGLYADQDYRRFGSLDRRTLNSNPGNISSRTTANLPSLTSRIAAVPQGSSGIALTPADFLATAGQQNLENSGRFASITPDTERSSAVALGEFDVTGHLTVFGELLYADRRNTSMQTPVTLANRLVPATNAFNPFGVAVSANYMLTGIGPRLNIVEADLARGVAGVKGLMGAWDWEASALVTDENAVGWVENNVDTVRVNNALASSDPAQALNIFADGPGGNATLLTSLIAAPVFNNFSSAAKQGSTFIRGPVVELPGGSADLVVGGEWRTEDIKYDQTSSGGIFISKGRRASSAFSELRLPLVGGSMRIAAIHALSLTLAGRFDRYSDFGETFNPQYGLLWKPLPDLLFRVSRGTSFRPPSLFNLHSPQREFPGNQIADPHRSNEIASFTLISGGNPNLEPEESSALTTGFVATPRSIPGLRISASYWRIEQEQRILNIPTALLVANEALFAGRIVRADPTPADVAVGRPGSLLSVDISSINFGQLETSGIDAEVSHAFDTSLGKFHLRLSGTYISKYETVDLPGTTATDRVGIASAFGTIPSWRAVASFGWSGRGLALNTNLRYTPAYDDATTAGPTGREVGADTVADVQGSIDFGDLWQSTPTFLSGVKVTLGVLNVFDEEPNYSEISFFGHDPSQGDARQRFGYINISKTF